MNRHPLSGSKATHSRNRSQTYNLEKINVFFRPFEGGGLGIKAVPAHCLRASLVSLCFSVFKSNGTVSLKQM